MTWKQTLDQANWPTFQCFGEESVIRVSECRLQYTIIHTVTRYSNLANIESLLERDSLDIDKETHQFGNRHRRVSVVQLNCYLYGDL